MVIRFPAGPREASSGDPPKGKGRPKKNLSRLGLAVLFCVAVFCVALVGLLLVLVFGLFVVTS